MNFAVVKISGKQYLVSEGQQLPIEGKIADGKDKLDLAEVLLVHSDDKVHIGTPLVDGAVVKADVVSTQKGDKIRVAKFKAKSRYRRVMGFRPWVTTLKIASISVKSGSPSEEKPRSRKK